MRVATVNPRPRVAFIAEEALERHVPRECSWAEARIFPVAGGAWREAARAAAGFLPEVSIVLGAAGVDAGALALLPGIRIGVVTTVPDRPGRARLAGLVSGGGFTWLTWPAPPPLDPSLRILQCLPLPVDTARALPAVALERMGVAAVASAPPPPSVLERVRAIAPVAILDEAVDLSARLAAYGVLLHWSEKPLAEGVALQALANGLLLVSNRALPEPWAIEPEDEYLLRLAARDFADAVEAVLRAPEPARAVRLRAWQKVREAFAADRVFERLVHDALLEADAAALLGRIRRDGDGE